MNAPALRLAVVAPRRPGQTSGNAVTAERYVRRLGELGHRARVVWHDEGGPSPPLGPVDAAVVVHARRGAATVAAAADRGLPVAVVLAGTDLYADLPDDPAARASLDRAGAVAVLQPAALARLAAMSAAWAAKATVVHQSVDLPAGLAASPDRDAWRVVVLAHLREVKDPLLAARAAATLPPGSRLVVDHAGAAHDDGWRRRAEAEGARNPRYRWHGEVGHAVALDLLAGARVLACTSHLEGGANVVSEALALGVAVVGTRIDGNAGLLGADHPGLVPVGDHRALGALLAVLEGDPRAWEALRARSVELAWQADPATERSDLAGLVARLMGA